MKREYFLSLIRRAKFLQVRAVVGHHRYRLTFNPRKLPRLHGILNDTDMSKSPDQGRRTSIVKVDLPGRGAKIPTPLVKLLEEYLGM